MSYNGYNDYSPYFNQQRALDARNQYAHQTPATQASYNRQSNAAPNTNLNGQQQSQPLGQATTYSSSAYGEPSRYSGVESSGSAAYQNPRTDYSYTGARSPENTTALGSLAYASSLRQDRSGAHQERDSLQRVADFNRATSDYTGNQHPGSRGLSYSNYSPASTSRADNQYQSYGTPRYAQATSQSTPYGAQLSSVGEQRSIYKPPSRPSSGQNVHAPRSQLNAASNQTPRTTSASAYQSPATQRSQSQTPPTQQHSQQLSHQSWAGRNGIDQSGSHDPQASHSQPSQAQHNTSASTSFNVDRSQTSNGRTHTPNPSNGHQGVGRADADQSLRLPSINGSTDTQSQREDEQSNSIQQHPATIDPNKVFNQYEYQRRQAAVAAEAKAAREKAALEAEEHRKKAEHTAASTTPHNNDESARKEQMEAEMKLMLEKMRDYKSKDPTLFSQIWEQVKKAQPPSSTRDALPASKEVSVASPRLNGVVQLPSPSTTNPAQPDPNSQLIQKSASPAVEEIDRGRFPAARRRGKLYRARPSQEQPDPAVVDSPASGPPEGYVRAGNVDVNQPVQRVWVSGKGNVSCPSNGPNPNGVQADKVSTDPALSQENSASQSAAAPQSTPRPTGQTHWPEEDKWALAIAARDTLLSNPVNKGKEILSSDIRNLLDQGPSYEELCSILERKGFVVERTPFAQQLLSAVPRLKQQRPEQTAQSSTTTPAVSKPIPASSSGAGHERGRGRGRGSHVPVAHMYDKSKSTPTQSKEVNWNGQPIVAPTPKTHSSASKRGPDTSPYPFQATSQPKHTKQQNAKKRSFGEIVDLTADGDSDEELERQRAEKMRKIQSVSLAQAANVEQGDTSVMNTDSQMKSDTTRDSRLLVSSDAQPLAAQSDEDVIDVSRFKNVMSPQRERLRKAHVVKSMNRDNALRRSKYNSRTIARDILVAAGKHPVMPALNYHLDGLRANFRNVDNSSDLSTFDWALVDPGGPPPTKRSEDVEMQDKNDEAVALSTSIGRPGPRIAIPTGGGGEENTVAVVNTRVKPFKGTFSKRRPISRSSDFMQSRPSFAASESPGQPQPSGRHVSRESGDVSRVGAGGSSFSIDMSSRFGSGSTPSTPRNSRPGASQSVVRSSEESSEHRRRGRPPGSKNKGPRNSLANRRQTSPSTSDRMSIPSRPHPNMATFGSPNSGPARTNTTPATTTNARRLPTTPARPSGLRHEVTISPAAGFAVVIPSPSVAGQASRRGSSILPSSPIPKGQIRKTNSPAPIPKRQVYNCRWKDCQAELHNLETLRKHVRKHMNDFDEDSDYQCLWAGCGNSKIGTLNPDTERELLHFKSAASWERHMDGRHLDHYAWELGDGPSSHPSGRSAL